MLKFIKTTTLVVLLSLLSFPIFSQTVFDFENLGLNEGDQIFDQYADGECGVRFYIGDPANNQHPLLARVGSPLIAFQGPTGTSSPACNVGTTRDDMPDPSANAGCWFLTDDGILNSQSAEIRVLYNSPTTQCSGDLIDIDGNETWTIEAYSGGSLIATQSFTVANATPGDGMATPWQFNLATPLDELRFSVSKPGGSAGIAFDNFSSCSIPQEICCPGKNLIENGDFNQGNFGFWSAYNYEPNIALHSVLQNEYTITNFSGAGEIADCWRVADAATCDDDGRFMVINGNTCDPVSNIVWATEVGVEENTVYQFCAFLKNLPNCCFDWLPHVTILISGQGAISQTISTGPDPCDWQLIAHTFNSGSNSSLNISIILDGAPGWDGNDLAIDEISLKEIPQVPNSQVMFSPNVTPDPTDPLTFFNVNATPLFPLDSGCTFSWEVCQWDPGAGSCIAGTEVINPPAWQTIPTNFPGYVGSSILAGSNPGRFDYNRSYRIVYSVVCPCETENSSAWIYDPNPMRTMETSYFMETQMDSEGNLRYVRSDREMGDVSSGQNKMIEDGAELIGLEIVPNPASNQATILYNLNSGKAVSMQLVNAEGQVVFDVPVNDQAKGQHQQKLELSDLASGIYLVRMEIGDRTLVRKLVIQD